MNEFMEDKRNNLNEYNWNEFFEEFQKETPRAAVIVSGAFLDSLLRDLLSSYMVDDRKVVNELLGTEHYSETPLGSFGARIKTAYCLGLISKLEYNDLQLIKNIRNRFAHKLHGYSFDDKEIIKWCDHIQTPKIFNDTFLSILDNHRDMYVFTISILSAQLVLKIQGVQKERRVVRRDSELGQVVRVIRQNTTDGVVG